MTADQEGRARLVFPFTANEQVGHVVLKNCKTALNGKTGQKRARRPVLWRKCLPIDTARRCCPDCGEIIETFQQSLAVDLRVWFHGRRPAIKAVTRAFSTLFHHTPSYFKELATMTPSTMSRISRALSGVTPLPTSVGNPAASLIMRI